MELVMVSGGLDSFLASRELPDLQPLFVDYGQPYARIETAAVRDLFGGRAREVVLSGLPAMDAKADPFVPARNLMFATVAARLGSRVCLAGMQDEQCSDKSPASFRAMSAILSDHCRGPFEVFSPFWDRMKADAVRDFLGKGGDPADLLRTVSCYGDEDGSCLRCECCFRRAVALLANGVKCPLPTAEVSVEYGLAKLHTFQRRRQRATVQVLRDLGRVRVVDLDAEIPPLRPGEHVVGTTRQTRSTPDIVRMRAAVREAGGVIFFPLLGSEPSSLERPWWER